MSDSEAKPGPSRRMIDPDLALKLVVQAATRLAPQRLPLAETCGLQLAEEIRTDRDYPPFPRAMMDGYAVRAADAGKTVDVVAEAPAGKFVTTPVVEGQSLEIMTGAPCPPGTEAVVPKERVHRDGDRVTLPGKITGGEHIAPQGSECPADTVVLRPGDTMTPLATAVVASIGATSASVTRRPSLAVITTGSELVSPGVDPAPGQIRDSNGPMLVAMARDLGIGEVTHLHVDDSRQEILSALGSVAQRDIVLLTGGVSVGTYDLVPGTLEEFGAELIFHKVMQKPGKPLLVAGRGAQLLFGLPGNPLACHLCFHRYVASAVRLMEGKTPDLLTLSGVLAEQVQPKRGRTYFVAGRAVAAEDGSRKWKLQAVPGVSSADIFASCGANCYMQVPPGLEPIPVGQELQFTWIGGAPWPN